MKKIAKSLSITENQVNIEDIKKVEVNGINLIHAYVKTNEGTGICVLGFHKNILISEAACLGHIKKEYVKNLCTRQISQNPYPIRILLS